MFYHAKPYNTKKPIGVSTYGKETVERARCSISFYGVFYFWRVATLLLTPFISGKMEPLVGAVPIRFYLSPIICQ